MKKNRTSSPAAAHGFACATKLAGRVDLLAVAPLTMVEGDGAFFENLERVRYQLFEAYKKRGATAPAPGTVARLIRRVRPEGLGSELDIAINSNLNLYEEAGYLYGLAMGLRLR